MKLNVLERVTLMGILPAEANLVTFKILTDLKKSLSFSEKEIKDFGIMQKEGRIFWKKSTDKEIAFGEQAKILVKAALQKIDADGKVNDGNYSLFEKFQPEIAPVMKVEK